MKQSETLKQNEMLKQAETLAVLSPGLREFQIPDSRFATPSEPSSLFPRHYPTPLLTRGLPHLGVFCFFPGTARSRKHGEHREHLERLERMGQMGRLGQMEHLEHAAGIGSWSCGILSHCQLLIGPLLIG